MPFCSNCGIKLDKNAKFCNECGAKIETNTMPSHVGTTESRETIYDGEIHKCPNCGEVLESFISTCPTCGYELRDVNASDSIVKFYNDLRSTSDNEQKRHLIRTFPIPNAKEDIIEFMILASSNLFNEDNIDIYNAWISKFDQCYQKAMLLFKNDGDFVRIQKIYNDCQEKILAGKDRKTKKITTETIIRNIAVCVGAIILLIAILVDKFNGNSVLYEIISYVLFIVSAATLVKRGAVLLDYAVAAGGGLLLILGSFLLDNGSMAQLCGGIVLVIMAVNYFKSMKSNKQE